MPPNPRPDTTRPASRNARARATRHLEQVVGRRRSLDAVLRDANDGADRDAALVAELVFGSVRHWFSLEAAVARCLERRRPKRDVLLECLLVVGAYQLLHMRIPAYAAVSETVAAAAAIGRTSAKGFVNHVLRALAAATPWPASEVAEALPDPVRFDHPQWLIDRLRAQYPDCATEILTANNARAPMALRINVRRIDRDRYCSALAAAGIGHHAGVAPAAVVLEAPQKAASLPGFASGWFSVQDEGAQLAVDVLAPLNGERVLDACAAPGGKTAACLERADVEMVALDVDPVRCATARRELERLGLEPRRVQVGDATGLDWWDGRPFARVLLDAPCSGTGTVRRHPDIKLLRRESDIAAYRAIQSKLLRNLWEVLEPGGRLVYCTCSILDDENDAVVEAFLATTANAQAVAIDAAWGRPTRCGRIILPTPSGPDGFYFAALTKAVRTP
jgi:16S rRNA (cytosine967-C5)-methyltransferase